MWCEARELKSFSPIALDKKLLRHNSILFCTLWQETCIFCSSLVTSPPINYFLNEQSLFMGARKLLVFVFLMPNVLTISFWLLFDENLPWIAHCLFAYRQGNQNSALVVIRLKDKLFSAHYFCLCRRWTRRLWSANDSLNLAAAFCAQQCCLLLFGSKTKKYITFPPFFLLSLLRYARDFTFQMLAIYRIIWSDMIVLAKASGMRGSLL